MKTCKCGTEFVQYTTLMTKCAKCLADNAKVKREESNKLFSSESVKKAKVKLKELDRTNLRWQHPLTQKAFNKMRVLQEKLWYIERGLEPVCISCGKSNMDFCCGHLSTVGAHAEVRYDSRNTYLQCNKYCNSSLSGNINGNKHTRGYLQGLVDRFGEDEAEEIIQYCKSQPVKKWNWQEVEEIRENANKEIRRLEKLI